MPEQTGKAAPQGGAFDAKAWLLQTYPDEWGGDPGPWEQDIAKRAYAAAQAASATHCNRCASKLCEHDNCTDWTCARACSKCAKEPPSAPAKEAK